jgi:cytochrome c oxidase assembly factor 6
MGLWSSSNKPSPPAPKLSSDGAPIAPDRSQRAKCWEARDAYFRCLDKNGIVDSFSEKEKAEKGCGVEGIGFEANCASSWVSLSYSHAVLGRVD